MSLPPEYVYVCLNVHCVWEGKDRIVQPRVVAPGLYENPQHVVCECNWDVWLQRKLEAPMAESKQ